MQSAYIFCNGNAIFFDEKGEQIIAFQKYGVCGLHQFVKKYPDAPVYWAVWKESAHQIDKDVVPWLLRHLRRTPGPRPEPDGGIA
jgi:hypothetical protein